jgi:hypothetical protein
MKRTAFTVLLAGILSFSHAQAAEIKGIKFAEAYSVGGQTLQLNGVGVRVKFFIDVYAAGLYLPKKEPVAGEILKQPGTKSVQIVMLREISGDDFADATEKGFKANHSDEELAKLRPKLDEILALMRSFGTVKKGTVVNIDIQSTGVSVSLNGSKKGHIASADDFGSAVIKNWLGNKPVDGDLKKAMLGA